MLAGSVGGFLVHNRHPASVFMGDSGSMFLGYALGVVSIIGGAKIATTMLVLGVPVLDALLVILQRSWAGRHPWRGGDNAHLIHRLHGIGLTQRRIALLVYAICALFGWLATSLIRTQKFSWKSDGAPHFGVPVPSSQPIAMPSGQCTS